MPPPGESRDLGTSERVFWVWTWEAMSLWGGGLALGPREPEVEGNYVPGLGLTRGPCGPTSAHWQNSGGIQHLHSWALTTSSSPEL